jgi:hypothetical protein
LAKARKPDTPEEAAPAPDAGESHDPPAPVETEKGPEPLAEIVPDGPARDASSAESPLPGTVVVRRGGVLSTFLGGVAAAAVGFGSALYLFPEGWAERPVPAPDPAITGALQTQADAIAVLRRDVTALGEESRAATAALGAAQTGRDDASAAALARLSEEVAGLGQAAADTAARLTVLEKRPVAGGAASQTALDAFERDLADLRSRIEEQSNATTAAAADVEAATAEAEARIAAAQAEAERLKAEAAEIAGRERARAAMSQLTAALDNGLALGPALDALTSAGIDVPAVLSEQAQGVPSLSGLKSAFPEAARAALKASIQAEAGDGLGSRLAAFLRSQTGARSLAPRAGDDPDAVLSRAEAALNGSDLRAAIAELQGLPEAGQAIMAEWVVQATKRLTATEAAAALAATVGGASE